MVSTFGPVGRDDEKPDGLFAGVAPATVESIAEVRWGDEHRAVTRADSQWLADVIERLEACPDLLDRLDVVFSNLAVRRGPRLEAPRGPDRVTVRFTSAVAAVQDAAGAPIRFGDLANNLIGTFPAASSSMVHDLLTELVRQGVLCHGWAGLVHATWRAPLTSAATASSPLPCRAYAPA